MSRRSRGSSSSQLPVGSEGRQVSKGTEDPVDLDTIRDVLHSLRPFASTKITDLNGNARINFDNLKAIVRTYYSNPEEYRVMFDQIKEIFGSVSDIQAGTVAAYCIGCITGAGTANACVPTCAGSAPNPDNPELSCRYPVIWVKKDGNTLSFQLFNEIRGEKNAIIAMDAPVAANFKGFKSTDLAVIRSFGVTSASLARIVDNNIQYVVEHFMSLDDLSLKKFGATSTTTTTSNTAAVWGVVILVILIIIVVAIAVKYRR